MDYSKLSDFEINREVAIRLGLKPYYEGGIYSMDGEHVVTRGPRCLGRWEPCKEAYQGWSIIVGNRISLDSIYERGEKWLSFAGEDGEFRSTDANPLRAAMIVFLMMQGVENDK